MIEDTLHTTFLPPMKLADAVDHEFNRISQELYPGAGFPESIENIYISGPVTGIPDGNKPKFMAAEYMLRKLGFHVFNPATIPWPSIPIEDDTELWKYFMHHCVAALPNCDSIFMLAGWQNSKGAVWEHRIAQMLGLYTVYAPVNE